MHINKVQLFFILIQTFLITDFNMCDIFTPV